MKERQPVSWTTFGKLSIAVVCGGLAAFLYFRARNETPPAPTDSQAKQLGFSNNADLQQAQSFFNTAYTQRHLSNSDFQTALTTIENGSPSGAQFCIEAFGRLTDRQETQSIVNYLESHNVPQDMVPYWALMVQGWRYGHNKVGLDLLQSSSNSTIKSILETTVQK